MLNKNFANNNEIPNKNQINKNINLPHLQSQQFNQNNNFINNTNNNMNNNEMNNNINDNNNQEMDLPRMEDLEENN